MFIDGNLIVSNYTAHLTLKYTLQGKNVQRNNKEYFLPSGTQNIL